MINTLSELVAKHENAKTCAKCGNTKHIHDYYMKVGVRHRIKTVDNTRDICKVCTEVKRAEAKQAQTAERNKYLLGAWI